MEINNFIYNSKEEFMSANTCPVCGKEVMPYRRFIREAEPWKISLCGSCGTKLRRSRKVFLFLFLMILPLAAIGGILSFKLVAMKSGFWIIVTTTLLLCSAWVILTNYLAWRLVGWISVEKNIKSQMIIASSIVKLINCPFKYLDFHIPNVEILSNRKIR